MKIFFPNIQHSGTAFVLTHLLKDYDVEHCHIKLENMVNIAKGIAAADLVITTIRDGIEESWRERGMEGFDEVQSLFEAIAPECYVLKIDEPDKAQPVLDQINEKFGLRLETDWRVVPSLVSKIP